MECKEVCILAHGQTAKQLSTFSSTGGFLTLSVLQLTGFFHFLLQIFFYLFVWFFPVFLDLFITKKFVSYFCSLVFFNQVSKKSVCVLLKGKDFIQLL